MGSKVVDVNNANACTRGVRGLILGPPIQSHSPVLLFSEYPQKQFCGVVQRIQPAHDLWYWHHAAAMHLPCPPLEMMRKCPTADSRVHLVLSGLWMFLYTLPTIPKRPRVSKCIKAPPSHLVVCDACAQRCLRLALKYIGIAGLESITLSIGMAIVDLRICKHTPVGLGQSIRHLSMLLLLSCITP